MYNKYAPAVCTCTVCVHMYIVDISYRSVHACKEMYVFVCIYTSSKKVKVYHHCFPTFGNVDVNIAGIPTGLNPDAHAH